MASSEDLSARKAQLSATKQALLAQRLQGRLGAAEPLSGPQPRPQAGPAPLSFAQQRLWFLHQWDGQNPVYNIPLAVELRGPLIPALLARALGRVVERHTILRTTYAMDGARAVQIVAPPRPWVLPLIDLRALDQARCAAAVQQVLLAESRQLFDLGRGPVLRTTLLKLGADRHVLIGTLHHIAGDALSVQLLLHEVAALYDSFALNRLAALPDLPIQYADYAWWQNEWSQSAAYRRQLDYWKAQLRGSLPALALPADRPRPPIQSYRGARLARKLPPALAGALRRMSQAEDVTLFMTLLAGFEALLGRYTSQDDLLVGSSIANRNHAAIERLIGLFVNLLVLRTDLSGRPTFRELLARVRQVVVAALAHQDLPFEQLVQELQQQRDTSRTPLFQVAFVFASAPPRAEFGALRLAALDVDNRTAKYDLTLFVIDTGESLRCEAEYNTDLFDAPTLERLLRHYQVVLEGAVAQPERAIAALPLLSAAERQQLLVQWNDTRRSYPQPAVIHALFERQAERGPDATALVFDGTILTYRELNRRANQLAHHLRQHGIGPEALVGIYTERSANMVIALLGVLKAGAAYVPLDPSFPLERVAFMLEDTQLPVLLTEAGLADELPVGWVHVIDVDSDWPAIALQPAQNPGAHIDGEQRAYVMYTSGSTGVPKGIDVCHRGVVRLLCGVEYIRLGAEQTFLHLSPIAFDASTLELWGALLHGGACVLLPERIPTAGALRAVLGPQRISTLWLTASLFNVLIDEAPELFAGVRQLLAGGEALSAAHVRRALAALPAARLINGYGPTESTTFACCYPIPSALAPDLHAIPIGRPIANTHVYILDARLAPVPIGVVGELYIGGDGLARGYLARPDLTAERFVPNPFATNDERRTTNDERRTTNKEGTDSFIGTRLSSIGYRLYRTGDLARYRPDGAIEFAGRVDTQVKLRGFRIELEEIEAVLAQHPAVRECAVVPREERLVAYVVLVEATGTPGLAIDDERPTTNDESSPSSLVVRHSSLVTELRALLTERLPAYMVPSAFVLLDALPLTPTGKIDRQALPAVDPAQAARRDYAAPRSDAERTLAAIWAQVLGVEPVGIDDSFFELGGDSIRGIQLLAQAQERGLSFSIHQLFQHPTIRGLAETLRPSAPAALPHREPFSQLAAPRDLPDDIEDAYPPTMLQAGMLFHSEDAPDAAIYHDLFSYHLRLTTGVFDPPAFESALRQLAARHGILRTSFDFHTLGEPLQLVHRSAQIPLVIEDLRGLAPAEQERLIAAWRADEQRTPFDWSRAPLMRVRVHRRDEHEIQLTLSFHHAILDGWSVAMLLTELFQRYAALAGAGRSTTGPLAVTFGDFVALEQRVLRSAEARQYWQQMIDGASPIRLPRVTVGAGAGILTAQEQLAPELGERLQALARELDVPLRSVLLAAYLRVLSVLGATTDVLTGLVVNGRPETTDGERVLGLFLNTVPFRLRLPGGTWAELVRATFGVEQALLPYRRYPIARIQQLSGGRPLFETTFNFVHFHVYQKLRDTNSVVVLGSAQFERTNFALTNDCYLDPLSGQIQIRLSGSGALLDDAQLRRLGGYYRRALELLASDPAGRYQARALLTDAERQQVLIEWNATEANYPPAGLPALFEAQAARTPGAVAVRDADSQLTYAELNRRANQLAMRLRQLGVAPEAVVGVLLPRTRDLVVALLAVLKAGAAYVPLDPAYPAERLAFMLEDSRARVIVTNDERRTTNDYTAHLVTLSPCHLVYLDADWPAVARLPEAAPYTARHPEQLAYVIYTSGSTGVPKGVQIPQRALVNCLCSLQQQLRLTPQDVLLSVTTAAFDIAALELFMPLIGGAQVVLAPSAVAADGPELAALLDGCGATVMQATPATWRLLLDGGWTGRAGLTALCGGEALPRDLAGRLGASCRSLWNMYGPTETTIWSASYVPTGGQDMPPVVPIGQPIANTQIYVLDAQLQPVPPGVAGDLYICGNGLARGYRGRPDLTAERFVPNPFAPAGSAQYTVGSVPLIADRRLSTADCRLYKTGDLARWRHDGVLEFLGRTDGQIKLRGYRIELDEIAAVLAQHPAVRASVVVLREDVAGDPRLVAYAVPTTKDEGQMTNDASEPSFVLRHLSLMDELRRWLKDRLPAYMLPSAFVLLDTLPLTPNSKVDRRALPPPEPGRPAAGYEFVAPRTETEALLAGIWAEAFGLERVGVDDDFFDLGGHSLMIFQVISRVRRAVELHVPMNSLQKTRTIARLAEYIELLRWARHGSDAVHDNAHSLPEQSHLLQADERGAAIIQHSNIIDLLSRLRRANVKIWAYDGTLRYSAPPGAISPALRAELLAHKASILAFLDEAASAQLSIRAEQRVVTGLVPLTPLQRKFFALRPPAPHHWNIATAVELPAVSAALIRRALWHVLEHHDALRLRFVQVDGAWQQRIADPDDRIPFSRVDLAALPPGARQAAFMAAASAQQASLNLAEGPLLRVALVERAPQPPQLLVIANHLVCDGFSMEILLQDLGLAYRQLAAGEPVRLPPKTTSFKQWAERLVAYARSDALRSELSYWLATLRMPIARLPVDRPGGTLDEAQARLVQVSLTQAETARLHDRLRSSEATLSDALLTALALAFARWAGAPDWLIELVSHGRETIFDDIDLSRTVGWLVSHAPARLSVNTARSAAANLQQVKAQVRALPNRGFGFEVLRYLAEDAALADELAALPRSQVIFNFLGRADGAADDSALFAAPAQLGPTGVHKNVPNFLLIFNGVLFDDRLYLGLTYSDASYEQGTIAALGEQVLAALRELL